MKILLISSNSSSKGGGEYFIIFLARAFNKYYRKNISAIYSNREYMNDLVKRTKKYCLKTLRINYKQLSQRKLRFLSAFLDLKQVLITLNAIRKLRPNIIIINQQYDEDGIDILLSAFLYKLIWFTNSVKIACIMHMPRVENKIYKKPFGIIRYLILFTIYSFLKPNFLLTSNECLNEFRKFYFFNKKNSFLIKSPLPNIKKEISKKYSFEKISRSNLKNKSKQKLKKWIENNRQIVLLGCQMVPQKNPIFALSSWLNLRESYGSDACLLIIGEGPLKNKIAKQISNLPNKESKDILQINWVPDLSRYILLSDLIIMPSSFEGMNLTLLECICYSKNILVNKFEGTNTMVKFTKLCTQIDLLDEALWAKFMNNKLSKKSQKIKRNLLNKKFISYYSDYECINSIKKAFKV
tara:strand:+ start:2544 stop:3773 length:1230 start_codon:yes stop_codon:yes gene_type:complete